jgi:glycosyltransferase involved in cell wall biosynthesis
MNKARIFILGKLPPPYYGPAIATQILLNSRLKDQFDLIHIDTKINQRMDSMGKFVVWKPFLGIWIYILFFFKIFNKKPDIILVPNGQTTAAFIKDSIFILTGWLSGSRVLLQLRGSNWLNWLNNSGKIIQWYVKQNLKLASGVIVLGDKLRYLFEGSFNPEKIFVVPNGADFTFPSKSNNNRFLSVLYLANLFPGKGIVDLLNAVVHLSNEQKNNINLNVVGSWSDSDFERLCKGIVEQNKIPVTFHSSKSGYDKLQILADADIFVFPPKKPEGHPWVIIEAMAAGLPIISTDQGAIVESVKDGINGFIVEPGNPEEIANKISFLISNPEIRISMGRQSRLLYEANFTEETMVERLSNVFNEILK